MSATRSGDHPPAANYSIPRQERECRTYTDRRGLTTDRVFVDPGESATTIEQPMFQEMLDYLRACPLFRRPPLRASQ